MSYETKDSGKREQFTSGMVRDVQTGKPRYDLIDRAFLKRWAELMARGAEKYGEENWRKATGEAELKRFKASALRHMMQWLNGETDEDHAAAVAFNLAGAEMVKEKLAYETLERVRNSFPDVHMGDFGSPCGVCGGNHSYTNHVVDPGV